MRTAAIVNLKGGVGKSTTAINLALIMATVYKYRVLLVDNDIQANVSKFFGVHSYDYKSMENVLRDTDTMAEDVIRSSGRVGLDIIPANMNMDAAAVVETLKNTIKRTSKKVSESDTTKEPQSQEKQGLAGAMNEPETGADEDQAAAADDEAVDIPEATAILTADLFNLREYISEDDFYNLQEIVINCELAARKGGENENNRS